MPKCSWEEAEHRLDQMVDSYYETASWRFGGNPLRKAIDASPQLKNDLLASISSGYLEGIVNQSADQGAAAGYSSATKQITLPEKQLDNRYNLIFTLGHENQHALNSQGQNYRGDVLLPEIKRIHDAGPPPHDYTQTLKDFIDHGREDEARAHIGGFNAVISALKEAGKTPTAQVVHDHLGARADDFMVPNPRGGYDMRGGLIREYDGRMSFSDTNVDAMKTHYSDKFPGTFGPNGLMDYRHQYILEGMQAISLTEKMGLIESTRQLTVDLESDPVRMAATGAQELQTMLSQSSQAYVDFPQLGTNPALLDVPVNGQLAFTNPIGGARHTTFEQDHPDFVVPRPDARQALGLPVEAQSRGFFSSLFSGSALMELPQMPNPDADIALPRQTAQGVGALKDVPGVENDDHRRNLIGALALEAGKQGMTSVDAVMLNASGDRLIAIQGDPASPDARRAQVSIAEAREQPLAQSLRALEQSQSHAPPTPDEPARQKAMSV